MKDWTLINEFGDRIEAILTGESYIKDNEIRYRQSYWSISTGKRVSGSLNKIKKSVNDFRGKKCSWKELWE